MIDREKLERLIYDDIRGFVDATPAHILLTRIMAHVDDQVARDKQDAASEVGAMAEQKVRQAMADFGTGCSLYKRVTWNLFADDFSLLDKDSENRLIASNPALSPPNEAGSPK